MSERLELEGKLDLAAVRNLHASLTEKAGKDLVIDLTNVTQIGALCAQTCIAAARKAKAAGASFQLMNASDHVLAQLNSMGMTPESIEEGVQ